MEPKVSKVTLDLSTQILYNHDDISIQKEDMVEITKKGKWLEGSEDESTKDDELTFDSAYVNKDQNTQFSEKSNSKVLTFYSTKKSAYDTAQIFKSSNTSNKAEVDLKNLPVKENRKLLQKNATPALARESQMLKDFLTVGTKTRGRNDKASLGSGHSKMKTGQQVVIRYSFPITDKLG